MPEIPTYTEVESAASTDYLVIETAAGTRKIKVSSLKTRLSIREGLISIFDIRDRAELGLEDSVQNGYGILTFHDVTP